MKDLRARCLGGLVATAMVVALGMPAGAGPTLRKRAAVAASYIASQQRADGTFRKSLSPMGTTADAVLAFVAARRGARPLARSIGYLADHVEDAQTTGLIAKTALAAVAAGRDPRDFGGRDLIGDLLELRQPDGQIGADTEDPGDPEVYDHALALIALGGAGGANPVRWLEAAQCRDGGWQYDDPSSDQDNEKCSSGSQDFSVSDSNTTALAVQALVAAGGSPAVDEAFTFFTARRDPDRGGWGYDPAFPATDANSTALVIQAHIAAGRALPDGAMRALKRLQYRLCGPNAGAFAFTSETDQSGTTRKSEPDLAATVAAVPALRKQALPMEAADVTRPPVQPPAC